MGELKDVSAVNFFLHSPHISHLSSITVCFTTLFMCIRSSVPLGARCFEFHAFIQTTV